MTQLIDKSALVAEIVKMLQEEYPCDNSEQTTGYHCALYELQDFINSLEVIEIGVDLGDPKGDKSAKYIIDTDTIEVKEVDLESLGFNTNSCNWMFGEEMEIIYHKEVLR